METETGAITPLSELLSAKKDGASSPPAAPEPVVETVAPETPQAAENLPDPAAPPAEPEPKTVPLQSYHAEKAKRQDLERRLAEYEAKIKAPEAPKPIDVLDPDYGPAMERRLAEMDWRNRVAVSEATAKLHHQDFDEVVALYRDAAVARKAPLIPMDHPNPAGFAYEIGKQLALVRDTGGDLAAYRSKVRAEVEAEFKAEQAKAAAAKQAAIMPTNAGERSATPDKGADGWSPKPLNELLKARNRR